MNQWELDMPRRSDRFEAKVWCSLGGDDLTRMISDAKQ